MKSNIILVFLFVIILCTLYTLPSPTTKEKYLLITIHDVSPAYQHELNQLLSGLEKRNITKFSLAIVPNLHESYGINECPDFIKQMLTLQDKGAELLLHGYSHNDSFTSLSSDQLKERLDKATTSFEKAFNQTPKGFVPPYWGLNTNLKLALEEKNLNYTESLFHIYYFQGREYRGFPIAMAGLTDSVGFTPLFTRLFSELYACLLWDKGGVVRYSLHPTEVKYNLNATFTLLDHFLEKGWKPVTYTDLTLNLQ